MRTIGLTIQEAIKSGKPFKRRIWDGDFTLTGETIHKIKKEDILAEDWEIEGHQTKLFEIITRRISNLNFEAVGGVRRPVKELGALYHFPAIKNTKDPIKDYTYEQEYINPIQIKKKLGIGAASRALVNNRALDYIIYQTLMEIEKEIGCKYNEMHVGEYLKLVDIEEFETGGYGLVFESFAMPFELEKRKVEATNE